MDEILTSFLQEILRREAAILSSINRIEEGLFEIRIFQKNAVITPESKIIIDQAIGNLREGGTQISGSAQVGVGNDLLGGNKSG